MKSKKLLRAKELAEVLGINSQTVYKLTRQRKIPFVLVGGSYRYDVDEVTGQNKKDEEVMDL